MRTFVQPPPSSHCDLGGSEVRIKRVAAANRILDLENEIFVCSNCGRELSCVVDYDNMPPHIDSEGVFRAMNLRSHYEKPSESKTRERQREKHEKTAGRKAKHVVAIGSAPEDKKV
jgi:hypothetical protein